MATRFMAIAVGLAAALAVAGCGGGKSSKAQTQPTKAEFVRKAQRICTAAGRKLEAAGATFFTTNPGGTEKKFVETKVTPIVEDDLIAKIDALPTPSGDEAKINAILDALRQGLTTLRTDPESIKAPSGSPKDPLRKAGELARAYGLRCGG
jgi:ABC-type glycerol-3-phosphate transport system substrate-binding protein